MSGWVLDERSVTPVVANVLLVAVTVVLVTTVAVAGSAVLENLNDPVEQASLDIRSTDSGIKASITASQTTTPLLVTRNGRPVGTMSSAAGTTVPYYGTKGDVFRFIALNEAGNRQALLRSVTIERRTEFAGRLSLDEVPLQDGTATIGGQEVSVDVSGTVRHTPGKHGTATQVLYRANNEPSGVRFEDVPEYESYTLSFLVRSQGDPGRTSDQNYLQTAVIGWEGGQIITATSGQNERFRLVAGNGFFGDQITTVPTEERYGSDSWTLVTVTNEAGGPTTACSFHQGKSDCKQISFPTEQSGASDFVIGDSKFSGEFDEVQLFSEPLSERQRQQLRAKYVNDTG
jgi:flagellin-like protein